MKKKVLCVLLSCTLLLSNNLFIAQAKEDSSDDWMLQELIDYEPYQELIKEHPNTEKVATKTKYILSEIVSDQNDNIIKSTEKSFSNQKSMDLYQKQLEEENKASDVSMSIVSPGETKYNTSYTKIRVGLSLYKLSSDYFFVAFVYDWLTPPPTTLLDYTKGAVGLCLDSGMSINASSIGGRVSATLLSGEEDMLNTVNGRLMIKSDSINGIGYAFSLPYATSDISGVISCNAYKNTPNTDYCSAFGEYDVVSKTLNLDDFSVSWPAGISFNVNTDRTRYTYGDALNIK